MAGYLPPGQRWRDPEASLGRYGQGGGDGAAEFGLLGSIKEGTAKQGVELLFGLRARKDLGRADEGVGGASPAPVAGLEGGSLGSGRGELALGVAAGGAGRSPASGGVKVGEEVADQSTTVSCARLQQAPAKQEEDAWAYSRIWVCHVPVSRFGRATQKQLRAGAAEQVGDFCLNVAWGEVCGGGHPCTEATQRSCHLLAHLARYPEARRCHEGGRHAAQEGQ